MLAYGDLLYEALEDDDDLREDVDEILMAAERARAMIKRVLTFGRPTQSEDSSTEVEAVLSETVKLFRPTLPPRIHLDVFIEPGLGNCRGDATQFQQIVLNLLTNAAHATTGEGRIQVVARDAPLAKPPQTVLDRKTDGESADSFLCVQLSDTGCGMDSATLERIFDPFFTTKEVGEGTGLGLATVHGMVTSTGGWITVYSTPGEGTTFLIFLPRTAQVTSMDRLRQYRPPIDAERLRVLVVDDEESGLRGLKRMLNNLGYQTHAASSANEALKILASGAEVDLVLTDLNMPQISGVDLARELGRRAPDTPLVVMSGQLKPVDVEAARQAGVKDFLNKPFRAEELAATLASATAGMANAS